MHSLRNHCRTSPTGRTGSRAAPPPATAARAAKGSAAADAARLGAASAPGDSSADSRSMTLGPTAAAAAVVSSAAAAVGVVPLALGVSLRSAKCQGGRSVLVYAMQRVRQCVEEKGGLARGIGRLLVRGGSSGEGALGCETTAPGLHSVHTPGACLNSMFPSLREPSCLWHHTPTLPSRLQHGPQQQQQQHQQCQQHQTTKHQAHLAGPAGCQRR